MQREDFSAVTVPGRQTSSKLDRWKPQIEQWLEEDRRTRFKQRHTAKRIHHRLREEHPGDYDCSYPLVQRYLKQRRTAGTQPGGFLELLWAPGEVQADFGEADLIEGRPAAGDLS